MVESLGLEAMEVVTVPVRRRKSRSMVAMGEKCKGETRGSLKQAILMGWRDGEGKLKKRDVSGVRFV